MGLSDSEIAKARYEIHRGDRQDPGILSMPLISKEAFMPPHVYCCTAVPRHFQGGLLIPRGTWNGSDAMVDAQRSFRIYWPDRLGQSLRKRGIITTRSPPLCLLHCMFSSLRECSLGFIIYFILPFSKCKGWTCACFDHVTASAPATRHVNLARLVPSPRNPHSFPCLFHIPTHLASNLATDDTRVAQNRQRNSCAPPRG